MSGTSSTTSTIGCGLPQGSVLGPILFVLYSADLLLLIERHQLTPHAFADDTQIYGFCRPSEVKLLSGRVSVCIDEVSLWMKANRLQLNHAKTKVIWFSSARRQHQIPLTSVRIGSTSSLPVQSVRDLGVYLNTDISLTTHVTVVRSCFASLVT